MDTKLENVYVHDFPKAYPKEDHTHMVVYPPKHEFVYDRNFMYRLRGFRWMFLRRLLQLGMILVAQPVCAVRYGLKIKGRKNIRKYKKLTDTKGMISVCNHTTEWDTLFINTARYFSFPEYPMWQEGAESTSGTFLRVAGGIVIAKGSPRGLMVAYRDMKNVVEEGKWLHVFPEAACWPFYPAIRNFQPGTFRIAVETGKPVLPMAVKYRPNRGLYKLFKKHPNAELRIGEPLLPDMEAPVKDAAEDLRDRCRRAVMELMEIHSEKRNTAIRNLFPTY